MNNTKIKEVKQRFAQLKKNLTFPVDQAYLVQEFEQYLNYCNEEDPYKELNENYFEQEAQKWLKTKVGKVLTKLAIKGIDGCIYLENDWFEEVVYHCKQARPWPKMTQYKHYIHLWTESFDLLEEPILSFSEVKEALQDSIFSHGLDENHNYPVVVNLKTSKTLAIKSFKDIVTLMTKGV